MAGSLGLFKHAVGIEQATLPFSVMPYPNGLVILKFRNVHVPDIISSTSLTIQSSCNPTTFLKG